ncbi:MAG: hypothetical protein FWG87_13810 [Defluviitaleaceae bacterium]|nr:hypothetical protein [Defluviitaleaceae bacterium]
MRKTILLTAALLIITGCLARDNILLETKESVIYMEGLPEAITLYPFISISEQEGIASFVIYAENHYQIESRENLLRITPKEDMPDLPDVFMEIKQAPSITVSEMAEEITSSMALARYAFSTPPTAEFPFLRLDFYDGDERDSTVTSFHIRDNALGGVFLATAQYFVEAAEGHNLRFMHYLETLELLPKDFSDLY